MTVAQLKSFLNALPPEDNDRQVRVWLPGSRIVLHQGMGLIGSEILIEGNLTEKSALAGGEGERVS
jgi:hypothetical protein